MSIRMRVNRSKTGKRRSHHHLAEPRLCACDHCGQMHVRHTVCDHCGYYRGRQVLDVAARQQKQAAKQAARAEAQRQMMGQTDEAAETQDEQQTQETQQEGTEEQPRS